ncbi:lysophospholipid acyltransferase family protein [Mongoliimonas terrestris]|uniref:lysophospholipid acyltransferase family protein n=1 Tax=Mongoliimonas terrestris TaxID=1709001 RepID=UPI0009496F6F|nr:lysophospholipid acyltransferase family protein [Mongoliimonas terrestris]
MARLRPFLALAPLVLLTLALLPVQMLAVRLDWRIAHRIPLIFHRAACRALGVRVTVHGRPETARPLLFAANHVSWLDIVVLGGILPLSFIAKSEIAAWPLFGMLARLQRTVFVERERRARTGDQAAAIAARLSNGDAMVLFAEGTTGDGNQILPFRSALVGAARAALDAGGHSHVLVQPVAIAYTRLHGLPMGRLWRPHVAWIGDLELPPHLLAIAREGGIDVTVSFGTPIAYDRDGDRKRVTAGAEASVRTLLVEALRRGG